MDSRSPFSPYPALKKVKKIFSTAFISKFSKPATPPKPANSEEKVGTSAFFFRGPQAVFGQPKIGEDKTKKKNKAMGKKEYILHALRRRQWDSRPIRSSLSVHCFYFLQSNKKTTKAYIFNITNIRDKTNTYFYDFLPLDFPEANTTTTKNNPAGNI